MTPHESLIDTPLSCDEALTVALVVLDIFCGDAFLAMTSEQRMGAILIVDQILTTHVMPVLEDEGRSAQLLAQLTELHKVADRVRRRIIERVH
jgi:hypothetical protein